MSGVGKGTPSRAVLHRAARVARPLLTALAASAVSISVSGISASSAFAQASLEPPFDASYTLRDVGTPPGVPSQFGGLTVKGGDRNTLLIGGRANTQDGALYAVTLKRDSDGHIVGFRGTARRFAAAPFNDGGVTYGPGGVLFLARWPANELAQIKPGSTTTSKVIDTGALGVASSLSALAFVPAGMPGAGRVKLSSWSGGEWYDATVRPDGSGTYDLRNVTAVSSSQLSGGPEGYVYLPTGSPRFTKPSLLVSEFSAGSVAAYAVDSRGNPLVATRRTFITGLDGAEGAFTDPVTGDFLFSTFGGGDHVVAVRGFATPPPTPGKTVNVAPVKGTVKTKCEGDKRFTRLTGAKQIPVGCKVDTERGTVRLTSSKGTAGGTQSGKFNGGLFKINQKKTRHPYTVLKLAGSLHCNAAKALRASGTVAASKGRGRKRGRRLWGNGKGKFRTRGRHGAGSVRGTDWLVADRCDDSTLFKVRSGVVKVHDFEKRKTVILRKGERYVARAKR